MKAKEPQETQLTDDRKYATRRGSIIGSVQSRAKMRSAFSPRIWWHHNFLSASPFLLASGFFRGAHRDSPDDNSESFGPSGSLRSYATAVTKTGRPYAQVGGDTRKTFSFRAAHCSVMGCDEAFLRRLACIRVPCVKRYERYLEQSLARATLTRRLRARTPNRTH
ncbi:unnamed protein product, partial [Iphiclides podalirius]